MIEKIKLGLVLVALVGVLVYGFMAVSWWGKLDDYQRLELSSLGD